VWILKIGMTAALAGCSFVSPGPVVATLPGGEGFRELPVVLSDPDGLVLTVEPGPLEPAPGGGPEVDRIDADTAVVRWLGGACDTRVRLRISSHDGDLGIGLQTDDGGSCVALGVLRAVSITFREPIGDRSIVLAAAP
jgi:hypothetical protein